MENKTGPLQITIIIMARGPGSEASPLVYG